MIRLRFLRGAASLRRTYQAGDEADWLDVEDAVRLIGAGTAEAVPTAQAVETADAPDETQTPEPPRRGPGRPRKQV